MHARGRQRRAGTALKAQQASRSGRDEKEIQTIRHGKQSGPGEAEQGKHGTGQATAASGGSGERKTGGNREVVLSRLLRRNAWWGERAGGFASIVTVDSRVWVLHPGMADGARCSR